MKNSDKILSQTLLLSLMGLLTACDSDPGNTGSSSVDVKHVTRKGDVELHQTGGGDVRIATDEDNDKIREDSQPVEQ